MEIVQLHNLFLESKGVFTDTRKIIPGGIFFALKGENFNGNKFAFNALQAGAAYSVVDEKQDVNDARLIPVQDVLLALQQLAHFHRKTFSFPVIAITGSNGKTTTKELTASVLNKKFNTLFTEGNLNNHIGVPLTLLKLTSQHEIAIVEMGANHQGEIASLCKIAAPAFGLISNVGKAHLEGFGGFEGVIKGKSELYRYLEANNGKVFLNSADPILTAVTVKDPRKIISYSTDLNDDAGITGKVLPSDEFLKIEWNNKTEKNPVQTHLTGTYNLENILAAICIGNYFNVPGKLINEAIANYIPSNQRSQVIKSGNNTIVMDAYNANPSSMKAALENFEINYSNHKIIMLGDMFELGEESEKEHRALVEMLSNSGAEKIILVGKEFGKVYIRLKNAFHFRSSSDAKEWVLQQQFFGKNILIKGSRGAKMEVILEGL